MFRIGKEFKFEAAHMLPGHEGQCANLHGHSYVLMVEIFSPLLKKSGSEDGMVMDFSYLSAIVKEKIIERLDHTYLNEVLPFRTTAENMAYWMFNEVRIGLRSLGLEGNPGCVVSSVTLYETATSYATYGRD